MARPGHEELDAQPTQVMTKEERANLNAYIGRLHAVLQEAQVMFEKLGNGDPNPRWKTWALDNAKIIGAMRRRLFSFM